MKKVCLKTAIWIFVLLLIIPGSVLTAEDPPSAQDQAVRGAPQPVAAMPVPHALHQALASSLSEATSFGAKTIPAPPTGTWGIVSSGDGGGGIFRDSVSEGEAWLGTDSSGVVAFGSDTGGHFLDSDGTGEALAGYGDWGIQGYGNTGGGHFVDLDTSIWASVANDIYKIVGTGAVSFVQNHPYDPSTVIVYAAPEGDEVATYTRGTARLVDGGATVSLGETFKWVTNPDIGLTAHLTPRGEPIPLAVVELSTEEMIVRAPSGAPEGLEFDYMVYGLRIGFEELSIVQEKEQESYIPSMASHRQLYERRPDLKSYNSL